MVCTDSSLIHCFISFRLLEQFSFDQAGVSFLSFSGDPASFVMGHIIKGKFDGSFSVFGETFHLEPVQRFIIGSNTSFHSIIFSASSVQFDFSRIQRKMARFNDLQHLMVQVYNIRKNFSWHFVFKRGFQMS